MQIEFLKGVVGPIPRRPEHGHLNVLKGRRFFSVMFKAVKDRAPAQDRAAVLGFARAEA